MWTHVLDWDTHTHDFSTNTVTYVRHTHTTDTHTDHMTLRVKTHTCGYTLCIEMSRAGQALSVCVCVLWGVTGWAQ